jgi:hypothetical protein
MPRRKVKPVDHDLAVWAKLGGGVLVPERELSAGEKIVAAGNEWVREQLMSSTVRAARSPFRRDRD